MVIIKTLIEVKQLWHSLNIDFCYNSLLDFACHIAVKEDDST